MKSLPAAFSLLPSGLLIIVKPAYGSVCAPVLFNGLLMNGSYWLFDVYSTDSDERAEGVKVFYVDCTDGGAYV